MIKLAAGQAFRHPTLTTVQNRILELEPAITRRAAVHAPSLLLSCSDQLDSDTVVQVEEPTPSHRLTCSAGTDATADHG